MMPDDKALIAAALRFYAIRLEDRDNPISLYCPNSSKHEAERCRELAVMYSPAVKYDWTPTTIEISGMSLKRYQECLK